VILLGILVASAVAAGVLYQAAGARRGARAYPPPGVLVDINRQRLHLVCAGAGRSAVLFESGIAASSLSWTHVQPGVAAFARTCAYDRAGLGWSGPSTSPRSVDRMLAELRGVLEAARMSGLAVLVGHSFGAFLVLLYAARYPDEIAGLVLLDPPTEWQHASGRRARLVWGGIQLSRLGGLLARVGIVRACLALLTGGAPGVPRAFVRVFGPAAARTVEHLVGEVRKLPPDVHPAIQALWCQPKCFHGMAEHLAALRETGRAAGCISTLADIPLAIVSAGDQPPAVLAQHQQLARLSSRGSHLIAARSGHWIHLDEPDLVVEVVRSVLTETRAP
jgi:pimeloyl-ACP methyl ester carboxylesterase